MSAEWKDPLAEATKALRALERQLLRLHPEVPAAALWHLTDSINSLTMVSVVLTRKGRTLT